MKCLLTITALSLGAYMARECWGMRTMTIYELADCVRGGGLCPNKIDIRFPIVENREAYYQTFLAQIKEISTIHYAFNHTLYQLLKTPESRDLVFDARFRDHRSEEEIFHLMIELVKKERPDDWQSLNLEQHTYDYHNLLELFRKEGEYYVTEIRD